MFRNTVFRNKQTRANFELLTEEKVKEIIEEYRKGNTRASIQKKYKLSRYYVDKIIAGEVEF